MADKEKYMIKVEGKLVEVTPEVYYAYFRMERQERGQEEKKAYNKVMSYDALDDEEKKAIDNIPDVAITSMDEIVIANDMKNRLHRALDLLPKGERELLQAIYFRGMTEEKYGNEVGISQLLLADLLNIRGNVAVLAAALCQNGGTECVEQLGTAGSDLAQTDDTNGLSLDLPAHKAGLILAFPAAVFYGADVSRHAENHTDYWVCDSSVKTVTVTANGTETVTFTNTHKGRGKIIKAMPDGGSAAGWEFEVYSGDNKLVGTFTTGEDGTVLTDYLLPGTYTVKEIIPEGSPYTCDAPNPKAITIEAGKTAEVTFTNRLKPGEILIQKVDIHGEPLAGAEFLLEWSADGSLWQMVTYTDSLDVSEGSCTSEGIQGGKLTSGEDGVVRFTGLSPGSLYRVTETKAPEGYQLLSESVHEGSIQKDGEYFIQLTVVNAPVFELPMTGSTGYTAMTAVQVGICVILLIILFRLAKKRR